MSLLSYSAIATKLRAMENRLFTENDYRQIASLESIPEFVEYLKRSKSYGADFAGVDSNDLHRGQIEKLLSHDRYSDFARIYRFANVKQRKYMDLYFLRFEAAVLKSCFRMVFDNQPVRFELSGLKDFFISHSDINPDRLCASSTLAELVENLKGSRYYEPLSILSGLDRPTLFDYETQLDLFYFTTVWKNKDKCLKGRDLEIITRIYGTRIDMVNLQWIYRTKKYHKLSPGRIYSFILPFNYKLKRSQLTALVEAADAEEFTSVYKTTCYGEYDFNDRVSLEDIHRRVQLELARTTARKDPYSIAAINSYLYNKEIEIRRLISALECIRYQLAPADALAYILK